MESCALITTEPNSLAATIHDRMPVILDRDAFDVWLDPATPLSELESLLRPYPAELMRARPVTAWVNKPAHDDPRCIEAAEQSVPPLRLFD